MLKDVLKLNKENLDDFKNKPCRGTPLRKPNKDDGNSSIKLKENTSFNVAKVPIWKKELPTESAESTNSSQYDVYDFTHVEDITTDDSVSPNISRKKRLKRISSKNKALYKVKRYHTKVRENRNKHRDQNEKASDLLQNNVTQQSQVMNFNDEATVAVLSIASEQSLSEGVMTVAENEVKQPQSEEHTMDISVTDFFSEIFDKENSTVKSNITSTPKKAVNTNRNSLDKSRSYKQQILRGKSFDRDYRAPLATPENVSTPANILHKSRRSSRLQNKEERAKILNTYKTPVSQTYSSNTIADCFSGYMQQNENVNAKKEQTDVTKEKDQTLAFSIAGNENNVGATAGPVNLSQATSSENSYNKDCSQKGFLGDYNKSISKSVNFYEEFEQSFIADGIGFTSNTKEPQHHPIPFNCHGNATQKENDIPFLEFTNEEGQISLFESPVKKIRKKKSSRIDRENKKMKKSDISVVEVEEMVKSGTVYSPEDGKCHTSGINKSFVRCEKQKAVDSEPPHEVQNEIGNKDKNNEDGDIDNQHKNFEEIDLCKLPTKETEKHIISGNVAEVVDLSADELFDFHQREFDIQETVKKPKRTYLSNKVTEKKQFTSRNVPEVLNFSADKLFEDFHPCEFDIQERVKKSKRTYSSEHFNRDFIKRQKIAAPKKKKIKTKADILAEEMNKHFDEIDDMELCVE